MIVTKWNGKPISKPGWYSDIPIERYHSAGMCDGLAVSSSNLRTCWSKSPAHMYHEWCENPNMVPRKSTAAMALGGVAHYLLMGEEDFLGKYVQQPMTYRDKVTAAVKPWNNNADFCKTWNAAQAKAGRIVAKVSDLDAILAMAKSLQVEPLVQQDLLRGEVECSGFVKDRETGLWLKVRPDVIPTTAGLFVDLKTASDVTTPAVLSSIRSLGYHQQGGLIVEAVEQLGIDHPFEKFVLLFVETSAPWCARSVPLSTRTLAAGRRQNRLALRQIAACIEAGHWPGPGEGDTSDVSLSNEVLAQIEARLKFEGIP